MRLDAVLPATELGDDDVSVGNLVEERLGKEVVDRLVEPLLGGVYAGHAREISAGRRTPAPGAARPRPLVDPGRVRRDAGARQQTPVFAGSAAAWAGSRPPWPRRPARRSAPTPPSRPRRRPGGGWNLVVGSTRDPEVVQADAVVLATPARATARLLSDTAPLAALELSRIEYASIAIVTLAFPGAGLPRRDRVRLPGPARRRAHHQGGDLLGRQVELGAGGRG